MSASRLNCCDKNSGQSRNDPIIKLYMNFCLYFAFIFNVISYYFASRCKASFQPEIETDVVSKISTLHKRKDISRYLLFMRSKNAIVGGKVHVACSFHIYSVEKLNRVLALWIKCWRANRRGTDQKPFQLFIQGCLPLGSVFAPGVSRLGRPSALESLFT